MTEIVFNELAPALNGKDGLIRTHWAKRRKIKERFVSLVEAQTTVKHKGKVEVEYERHSTRPMDWDNLCASFKIPGDALIAAGVITDDNPLVIVRFIPRWVKAKNNKSQKTVVKIYDVPRNET